MAPRRITLNPDCGFAPGSAAEVSLDTVLGLCFLIGWTAVSCAGLHDWEDFRPRGWRLTELDTEVATTFDDGANAAVAKFEKDMDAEAVRSVQAIAKTGEIVQLVNIFDTAWAQGRLGPRVCACVPPDAPLQTRSCLATQMIQIPSQNS